MHQYVVIVEKSTLPEDIKLLKKCSDDHLDYLKNLQKSGNLKMTTSGNIKMTKSWHFNMTNSGKLKIVKSGKV